MTPAEKLTDLGWSQQVARERMASCRRYAADYRTFPEHTRWTFRFLNAQCYRRMRAILSAYSCPANDGVPAHSDRKQA